jgi:hypothetical protein
LSLILPESQQNVFLENNLKALFARYPHERARLEPILRKPVEPFTLVEVNTGPIPSRPPIRILILLGIVNPQFLAQLLMDKTVRMENFKLFIFENDPEFIASVFQNCDITSIINYQKLGSFVTEWFICDTFATVKGALYRALRPEPVTGMMLNVQVLQTALSKEADANEFYKLIPEIYNETVNHTFHNHGSVDDSLIGLDVTFQNKDYLLNAPGITDLKNYFRGTAALICGAGPSLDANLDKIKKYNDRFVVIAADAAVKTLVAAGIRVDYCVSIERFNEYQKPFWENLPDTGTELVAFPVIHPDVIKMFPGTVRIVYRNYSFYTYFEKAYPKGLIRSGGSASHLGLRLASWMGCSKAYLIGLDSCYEEKDGLYRSHCSGTGYPEWGEYVSLDTFTKNRRHTPPIEALSNEGKTVKTNVTYYQWCKELSEELAYVGMTMPITNCSAIGLAISGIPFKDLEEVGQTLDPNFPGKPKPVLQNMTRNWDNSYLLETLQAWSKVMEDCITECDALSAQEEVDSSRYEALIHVLQYKIITDTMFVAFIIQIGATAYFKLDNRWYSLSLELLTDLKPKLQILKERCLLFKDIIEKEIKIIKEWE